MYLPGVCEARLERISLENACLGISVSRFHAENLQYPAVEIKPLNGLRLSVQIDVEEKNTLYFHQGMFSCVLVILILDKVDNDLKIASSAYTHTFLSSSKA